jgi:sulfate transport system substrate-binding protein
MALKTLFGLTRRLVIAAAIGASPIGLSACDATSDGASGAPTQLLNVSYDPTRELYEEVNVAFAARWAEEHGGGVCGARRQSEEHSRLE